MNETLINIGTDFENLEDKELLIKNKAVFMKEAFVTKDRIFTVCKNDITTIFILKKNIKTGCIEKLINSIKDDINLSCQRFVNDKKFLIIMCDYFKSKDIYAKIEYINNIIKEYLK